MPKTPNPISSGLRPILSDKCFACHGPDAKKRKGDLRLDSREAALEAKPADAELRLCLADLDLAAGDLSSCLHYVDGVLRQAPENARALSLRQQCQRSNDTE